MSARASILAVDDEQQNLDVFEAAFDDDYEIYTASSARDAIKILREHEIDLVISDQRMPQMTGVQLLEAISPEYPDTVRMILTGFTDIDAIIQAINTGRVDHYITKPWDAGELKMTLDRALDLRRTQRRNVELLSELEARLAKARELRETFQRYVPKAVVDDLVKDGRGAGVLKGEARMVAIAFIRIPGFDELSKDTDPKHLVRFLNAYFSTMSQIVLDHQGLVNEFFAEGILAVFGAPVSTVDNELNAVRAARAMVAALDAFNAEHAVPVFGRPISVGVGIHRGEVITGSIGASERMTYGVLGDTVNVAARIQSETATDRSDILLSGDTRQWLESDPELTSQLEPLGPVELRGKSEPIELFRVKS